MNLYEVVGYRGHMGSGKSVAVKFYIYAKDIAEALKIYKRVPGMKSTQRFFPDIRKCDEAEKEKIFEKMKEKIKRSGWFFPNE